MKRNLLAAAITSLFAPMAEGADTGAAPAPHEKATPKPDTKKTATKKAAVKKAVKKAAKKKTAKSGDLTGPAVLKKYAPEYHKDKEKKTAGGHVSVDSNDELAKKLRGKALDDIYPMAAKVLEVTEKELRAKYGKLNPGMQRMNLGNRMRAVLNAK